MIRRSPLAAALCACVAGASLLGAGPASAATLSVTPPPPTAGFCPDPAQQPDGSLIAGQEADDAGCVVVHLTDAGAFLVEVITAPGWTWADISDNGSGGGGGGSASGGGSGGRHGGGGSGSGGGGSSSTGTNIDVLFSQSATGRHVEVRMRPGRTDVIG